MLGGFLHVPLSCPRHPSCRTQVAVFSLITPHSRTSTAAWLSLLTTLKGKSFESACTDLSSNWRPMSLLMSNTVFSGLAVAWFFAASPIRRSPFRGSHATYDGLPVYTYRGRRMCSKFVNELRDPQLNTHHANEMRSSQVQQLNSSRITAPCTTRLLEKYQYRSDIIHF